MEPEGREAPDLPSEIEQALDRFLEEAEERFSDRIRDVRLFGSLARGEAGEDSDVDLLVIWEGTEGEAVRSLVPITTEILVETGVELAIHPMSPDRLSRLRNAQTSFYRNLERDGVRVGG